MDQEKVKLHEQFVVNKEGCSMAEVLWISLSAHSFTLLVIFVGTLSTKFAHTCDYSCKPNVCETVMKKKFIILFKEFVLVILPLILLVTVFPDIVSLVTITILISATITIISKKGNLFKLKNMLLKSFKNNSFLRTPMSEDKKSFATCCRSLVNIVTIICILAVDFNIFPRRFAKTETYGFSLMDMGVGLFIFSNASVIKSEKIIKEGLKKSLLGVLILFALGFFRYFSTQSINYQKNILEYGVHWNFFFTLGTIKIISFIILRIFKQPFCSGVLLGILHQTFLYMGLEDYVTGNQERNNFIDANREGLVSSLGYTSLFLIGISINQFVLKDCKTIGGYLKVAVKLICTSASLLFVTVIFRGPFPVSRRLINLTYISWVSAVGLLNIAIAVILEALITIFISKPKHCSLYSFLTPIIFESINNNGLTFFLLGNLLTGVVNILFDTIKMDRICSVTILVCYMFINCAVVFWMYFEKISFKFW